MTRLADIAPRLALARDQRRVELAAESRRRRRLLAELLEAERLVAHRELQLIRAQAIGRRAYIAQRAAKLESGRVELERTRRRARAAGLDA